MGFLEEEAHKNTALETRLTLIARLMESPQSLCEIQARAPTIRDPGV
jgi:hypothetical protein